jgi:hypothetical protein
MNHYHFVQYRIYYPYRTQELRERADRERLAHNVAPRRLNFYHSAATRLTQWLIIPRQHLLKRFGKLHDQPVSQPISHKT